MISKGTFSLYIILALTSCFRGGLVVAENVTSTLSNSSSFEFHDLNRAGFNPFQVLDRRNDMVPKSALAILTVASLFAAVYIPGNLGIAASIGLGGTGQILQPTPKNPDEIYTSIFGHIQDQANSALNDHDVAKLVARLETLKSNLHDESVGYLSELGLPRNIGINDTLHGMMNGSKPIPFVTRTQVDIEMKMIDALLSAPNEWFTPVPPSYYSNYTILSSFVLVDDSGVCLHTSHFNIADGSNLIVDRQCNINSLDDKMFALVHPNNRLILRTNTGDKCVTYNSKDGQDVGTSLAVFDVSSEQCRKGRPVSLKKIKSSTSTSESWSLFDGDSLLCLSKSHRNIHRDTIISTLPQKHFLGLWSSHNECGNADILTFNRMIPVVLNADQALASGASVTPPQTFDEIGVQLSYFSLFVTVHLASLKEMYFYGLSTKFAKTQFEIKLAEYKNWLATFIPIYEMYVDFARIEDAKPTIVQAKKFAALLDLESPQMNQTTLFLVTDAK